MENFFLNFENHMLKLIDLDLFLIFKKISILCVVPRKKAIPNLDLGEGIIYIYETKGNYFYG